MAGLPPFLFSRLVVLAAAQALAHVDVANLHPGRVVHDAVKCEASHLRSMIDSAWVIQKPIPQLPAMGTSVRSGNERIVRRQGAGRQMGDTDRLH